MSMSFADEFENPIHWNRIMCEPVVFFGALSLPFFLSSCQSTRSWNCCLYDPPFGLSFIDFFLSPLQQLISRELPGVEFSFVSGDQEHPMTRRPRSELLILGWQSENTCTVSGPSKPLEILLSFFLLPSFNSKKNHHTLLVVCFRAQALSR